MNKQTNKRTVCVKKHANFILLWVISMPMETFSEVSLRFLFSSNLWSLESVWKSMAWNLPPSHQLIILTELLPASLRLALNCYLRSTVTSNIFHLHLFHPWLHLLGLPPLSETPTQRASHFLSSPFSSILCKRWPCFPVIQDYIAHKTKGPLTISKSISFTPDRKGACDVSPSLFPLQTHKPCLLNNQRPSVL